VAPYNRVFNCSLLGPRTAGPFTSEFFSSFLFILSSVKFAPNFALVPFLMDFRKNARTTGCPDPLPIMLPPFPRLGLPPPPLEFLSPPRFAFTVSLPAFYWSRRPLPKGAGLYIGFWLFPFPFRRFCPIMPRRSTLGSSRAPVHE